MKKLAFCLVLLVAGTMVFAGCGQQETKPKPKAPATETKEEGGAAAETPAAPAKEEGEKTSTE